MDPAPSPRPPETGQPVDGIEADSYSRRPLVDWLTGLKSREAFAQVVAQAEADREPVALAVLALGGVTQINDEAGWDIGDQLLTAVGQALAAFTSVDVLAARLSGDRFGLLRVPANNVDVVEWLEPIVDATTAAIDRWSKRCRDFDQLPATPVSLGVGVATGFGHQAWSKAVVALDHGTTPTSGRTQRRATDPSLPIAVFSPDDPGIARAERRRGIADELATLADKPNPGMVARSVVPVAAGHQPSRAWYRLDLAPTASMQTVDIGETRPFEPSELDDIASAVLDPTSPDASKLDHHLVDSAYRLAEVQPGVLRLTLPMRGQPEAANPFDHRSGVLDRLLDIDAEVRLEVTQDRLHNWDRLADPTLVGCLLDGGFSLVISGCTGDWRTWRMINRWPVRGIKPSLALASALLASEKTAAAALRIFRALADNARADGIHVIAPEILIGHPGLDDLGFDYAETPPSAFPDELRSRAGIVGQEGGDLREQDHQQDHDAHGNHEGQDATENRG